MTPRSFSPGHFSQRRHLTNASHRPAARPFPPRGAQLGVKSLDGVILTHDHADAVLGLDDLRDLQRYKHTQDPVTKVPRGRALGTRQLC